jgi:hypothetical protein
LPKAGDVKLTVFNAFGKEVAVLVNEFMQAGKWETEFDASNLSSGVYFFTLSSGDYRETKKMLLVK